jgi:hypothetical protein
MTPQQIIDIDAQNVIISPHQEPIGIPVLNGDVVSFLKSISITPNQDFETVPELKAKLCEYLESIDENLSNLEELSAKQLLFIACSYSSEFELEEDIANLVNNMFVSSVLVEPSGKIGEPIDKAGRIDFEKFFLANFVGLYCVPDFNKKLVTVYSDENHKNLVMKFDKVFKDKSGRYFSRGCLLCSESSNILNVDSKYSLVVDTELSKRYSGLYFKNVFMQDVYNAYCEIEGIVK